MAARKGNMLGGSCLKQPLLRRRVCLQPYPSPGSLLSSSGSFLFPCGISCLECSFKGKYSSPLFSPLKQSRTCAILFSVRGIWEWFLFCSSPMVRILTSKWGRCPGKWVWIPPSKEGNRIHILTKLTTKQLDKGDSFALLFRRKYWLPLQYGRHALRKTYWILGEASKRMAQFRIPE